MGKRSQSQADLRGQFGGVVSEFGISGNSKSIDCRNYSIRGQGRW